MPADLAGSASPITCAQLKLGPLPRRGLILLRVRNASADRLQSASSETGLPLLVQPNRGARSSVTVLWHGPGQWLIVSTCEAVAGIRERLEAAFSGITCHTADLSDARIGFEVSGAQAPTLLSRLCTLDLHPAKFKAGDCARSLLVRIPLLLYRPGDELAYQLLVDRSLAHYAWNWLHDAGGDIAESVRPS